MDGSHAGVSRSRTMIVLSAGFRPFFLAASLWAAVALALWIDVLQGGMVSLLARYVQPHAGKAHGFFQYLTRVRSPNRRFIHRTLTGWEIPRSEVRLRRMPDHTSQLDWRVPQACPDFPSYTATESAADRVVHLVGLAAAAVAIGWLLGRIVPGATIKQLVAVSIYCVGLVGMLAASAVYNLVSPSRLKAVLRRLDHSMIFVMIAGSYTPFTMGVLRPQFGIPLCAVVWGLAAIGIALKLLCPYRAERASLGLYFGMGWLVLGILRPLLTVLPAAVLLLLLGGGLIYSLGAFVHARARMPFHNALWHAMVVTAAALHFAAVAELPFGPG